MTTLPPFLRPLQQDPVVHEQCTNAIFPHGKLGASAHALWWSASGGQPTAILFFIPGNPGLIEFYTPFLTAVHEKCDGKLAVLAHAHLGHSPTLPGGDDHTSGSNTSLTVQVESAIEAVDAIACTFPSSKVIIAAHSMGAWVTLQVLKAKPEIVTSVFLLFPTISRIASTPNGCSLSWLFRNPLPRLISCMSILTRVLPLRVLSALFPDWPLAQIMVLRTLLYSPSAVHACLSLAHDEMVTIQELDVLLLQRYQHRIHLYFAEKDDWVGEQKKVVLQAFHADSGAVKVVHGRQDIPHAFCINHGEELAQQCFEWLQSGDLIST